MLRLDVYFERFLPLIHVTTGFLVRRCGSHHCPVFQSPLHCDRLALQFHVEIDFSLCYWLLADLLQSRTGRDEAELLFRF